MVSAVKQAQAFYIECNVSVDDGDFQTQFALFQKHQKLKLFVFDCLHFKKTCGLLMTSP